MKKCVIPIIQYSKDKKEVVPTEENIKEIIEQYLENFDKSDDTDKDVELIISIKPNYINKKILKLFKNYKVKTVELRVPSTNDYILKRVGEKYNFKDVKKISKLVKFYGFRLGIQIIIGLPDSTKIDEINTVKNIIKLKPKLVSITPLLVLKDTYLEKEYKENKYKPLTMVQAVETSKELVEMLNDKKIEVIAVGYGLLDDDLEQLKIAEKVVDGPFHPSFRQLVESSLWYDAIVNKIKQLNVKVMQVEVNVNPVDVNNVIGYKQENIDKLKDLYDVDLVVTPNENLKQGKSKIEVIKIYQDFKS